MVSALSSWWLEFMATSLNDELWPGSASQLSSSLLKIVFVPCLSQQQEGAGTRLCREQWIVRHLVQQPRIPYVAPEAQIKAVAILLIVFLWTKIHFFGFLSMPLSTQFPEFKNDIEDLEFISWPVFNLTDASSHYFQNTQKNQDCKSELTWAAIMPCSSVT